MSEVLKVVKLWDGQRWRFCPSCQQKAFEFAAFAVACGETAWVSMHEKLPEIGTTALVWKERRGYDLVEYDQKSENHRLYTRRDGQWWDKGDRITDWALLPSPPTALTQAEEEGR